MASKIIAPTTGFGPFFVLHRFHGRSSRPVTITRLSVLHYLHEIQMFLQCFHVRIVKRLFASHAKSATQLHQHDALQGAHDPNLLLCVTFGAP